MSMTITRCHDVAVGLRDHDVAVGLGDLSIAARLNQIDWPPTNISGCRTLKFNIVIVRISVNEILVDETL